MKKKFQIFSIFGQIEEVAAKEMLKDPACKRIDAKMIPPTVRFNDAGQTAKFAIMLPTSLIPRFENLITDLRA